MIEIKVNIPAHEYNVTVGSGLLSNLNPYINLKRKVFILTDSGVPKEYAASVFKQCEDATVYTVQMGESAKSLTVYGELLSAMSDFGLTRSDCLIAVGGGVVGDLGGFLAATYMRGIDFYNIPTTVLSAVDSSIGGKCAINLNRAKNTVGAFYQPKAVVIDVDTFKTLDLRLINEGLAESLKMALTSDARLFSLFENDNPHERLEEIIIHSVNIKRAVVEEDERETGLRKILNFGHTLGHGIEGSIPHGTLYHGECVALGMLPMCSNAVRERLLGILSKLSLNAEYKFDLESALSFVAHDKKCRGDVVEVIFVDEIGTYRIESMKISDYITLIQKYYSKT